MQPKLWIVSSLPDPTGETPGAAGVSPLDGGGSASLSIHRSLCLLRPCSLLTEAVRPASKRVPSNTIRVNRSSDVTAGGDSHWRDASGTRPDVVIEKCLPVRR